MFSCVNCLNRTDPKQNYILNSIISVNIQKKLPQSPHFIEPYASARMAMPWVDAVSKHFDCNFIQGLACGILFLQLFHSVTFRKWKKSDWNWDIMRMKRHLIHGANKSYAARVY